MCATGTDLGGFVRAWLCFHDDMYDGPALEAVYFKRVDAARWLAARRDDPNVYALGVLTGGEMPDDGDVSKEARLVPYGLVPSGAVRAL